jgi:hypothetical protein
VRILEVNVPPGTREPFHAHRHPGTSVPPTRPQRAVDVTVPHRHARGTHDGEGLSALALPDRPASALYPYRCHRKIASLLSLGGNSPRGLKGPDPMGTNAMGLHRRFVNSPGRQLRLQIVILLGRRPQ